MRTIVLSVLIAFASSLNAQNIPNPGFETWVNNGSFEDPQGWGTFNFLSLYGNPITATKSTDAHSGTYAIRMESKLVTNNPNPAVYPDTIHTIYSGTTIPLVFGFPSTQKPSQLQMFYKSAPVSGSTAGVLAYLYKWNSALHKRDTVAYAASYMSAATSYTQLNVPFVYLSSLTPDTAIIFTSPIAYNTPHQLGAVLLVDDISFITATSVEQVNVKAPLLFWNSGMLTIANVKGSCDVKIFTTEGKLVYNHAALSAGAVNVDLAPGVYMYTMTSGEGNVSGKFPVIR